MTSVASIGTTHPWNIAGVGLDARVFGEYGFDHAMAVVAVTAQDENGVHAVHAIPPHVVHAQLESLPPDIAAFRVGALVSSETVRIVASFLRERSPRIPTVVDPVVAASLGGALTSDDTLLATLRDELLTLPVVVTPNVLEAEQLLDVRIATIDDARLAARRFVERGAAAAYVKGGHLGGDPADVLASALGDETFTGSRLPGEMCGSGCTLAAALAAELALGHGVAQAADAAHAYVRAKIAARTMRGGLQVAF